MSRKHQKVFKSNMDKSRKREAEIMAEIEDRSGYVKGFSENWDADDRYVRRQDKIQMMRRELDIIDGLLQNLE